MAEEKMTHDDMNDEEARELLKKINNEEDLGGNSGRAVVYGTPWDGKHRLSSNTSVPLKGLCILERAEENVIRRITKEEALPMLVQQTYRPADPSAMVKTMELIDRLSGDTLLYRMGCNMDISAAEMAYSAMSVASS